MPGEIVLVRGGKPIDVWHAPGEGPPNRVGVVMPTSMGIIVAVHQRAWTYVLWSMPCILGWVPDGVLRRVKTQ